ncbi:hypothetical protein NMU03_11670 [Allocoprobacillus halotolerans]|uniref:Acyltransferase-like protein n=1 Tax=Allocoprobacillus halotolerans TaxID=2944914 RepID=A0ABY5HZ10_9FIRM|nr:hypothetical protein [Allocoprobacillus halotolerans]UTY38329.1 hypothetical protein NMU03_11670 [Allocoprobacillus halotolerans]
MVNLNYVSRVDLFYQDLGNPILFLSSAISGIYMIIIFSKFIQNFKPIQYVGKNSLLFYAFHSPIFIPIADKIVEILIIQNIPLICYDTIKMFIALFTVCIGMVIVCEIVNRYFSFVLGKKKLV